MMMKNVSAIVLLASLSLFSQTSLAQEKVAPKQDAAVPAAVAVAAPSQSGKVNINIASLAELTSLKGIGEKKAQAIIDHREKQGKFTSIDQLADVSGIGPATLEANKELIIIK
ncbi:MAG: ComEA family DNA-binding protein [Aeromonas sp.]